MAVSLGSFSAVCSITGDKLVEWTSNLSLIYPLLNLIILMIVFVLQIFLYNN